MSWPGLAHSWWECRSVGRDEEEVTQPSRAGEEAGGILSGPALCRHKPLLETLPTAHSSSPWRSYYKSYTGEPSGVVIWGRVVRGPLQGCNPPPPTLNFPILNSNPSERTSWICKGRICSGPTAAHSPPRMVRRSAERSAESPLADGMQLSTDQHVFEGNT